MRVTGSEAPHKIIVEQDEALLWFVSNDETQGQGFRLKITKEPRRGDELTHE